MIGLLDDWRHNNTNVFVARRDVIELKSPFTLLYKYDFDYSQQ